MMMCGGRLMFSVNCAAAMPPALSRRSMEGSTRSWFGTHCRQALEKTTSKSVSSSSSDPASSTSKSQSGRSLRAEVIMSGELSMPRILACGYRLEKTRNAPPGRRDVLFCGAKGIRTPDPLHAMEMRYQLRHSPVELAGFEPATLCLQSRCATSCAIAP